jgi:hypothetical protein
VLLFSVCYVCVLGGGGRNKLILEEGIPHVMLKCSQVYELAFRSSETRWWQGMSRVAVVVASWLQEMHFEQSFGPNQGCMAP